MKTRKRRIRRARPVRERLPKPRSLPLGTVDTGVNFTEGFCNPRKIVAEGDAHDRAVESLTSRGWSETEAEQMLRDGTPPNYP